LRLPTWLCSRTVAIATFISFAFSIHRRIVHSEMTGPNPHCPLTWMVVGVSLMTSGFAFGMMWPRSMRLT
jgi:hypothetical protein